MKLYFFIPLLVLVFYSNILFAQIDYSSIRKQFETFDVILKPDKNEPEWWAGAPSVVQDDNGIFWMACRMRSADLPRGLRGYEIRILRSDDGLLFESVHHIKVEDVQVAGFERPALMIDPHTKKFKLYGCGPWQGRAWSIIKFDDADDPTQFQPSTAKPVIQPLDKTYERDVLPQEYKDPFILYANGKYHCYVIGVMRQIERLFHFSSVDGDRWEAVGSPYQPVMGLEGWHNFYVRPSCVLPLGIGYLFVYEGSNVNWYDPVYNIVTGLGFTFDLHHIVDITSDEPLLKSSTPNEHFFTFRYSHWLIVEDEIWIYAEVAAANETHEIRRFVVPVQAIQ